MVFYRKYRPQSLDQLIGQENVITTLSKAFQNNSLAHAYLFCGPRGTGKTSTARILAKMVNCEAPQAPCNSCSSCVSITDGSSLDVYEIDAASNRGIDDVRTLRENIKLSPSNSKKKVYIIDEVHMLTTEAFNALLKTLEEPPSHVLFVLATTEGSKIPQTILSRVQKIDFKLASSKDLTVVLNNISALEKIEISDDALRLIAKKAEGSFRDALKLLDQLASIGEKVGIEHVENSLRAGNFAHQLSLLDAISAKNPQQALSLISKAVEDGINVKEYSHSLMDILRSMLFIKQNVGSLIKEQHGSDKYQELVAISVKFSAHSLISYINCFQEAVEKLKFASIVSLPLEVALVQCCLEEIQSRETVTVNMAKSSYQSNNAPVIPSVVEGSLANASTKESDMKSEVLPSEQVRGQNDNNFINYQNKEHTLKDDQIPQDIITLQDKWTYILETVKPFNFSLEALLRSVKLIGAEDSRITLEVPYSFHQRILETPRNRDMLESIFSEVLGKSVKLSCVLGKRPMRIEEIANIEVAQEDDVVKLAAEIFNSES